MEIIPYPFAGTLIARVVIHGHTTNVDSDRYVFCNRLHDGHAVWLAKKSHPVEL